MGLVKVRYGRLGHQEPAAHNPHFVRMKVLLRISLLETPAEGIVYRAGLPGILFAPAGHLNGLLHTTHRLEREQRRALLLRGARSEACTFPLFFPGYASRPHR